MYNSMLQYINSTLNRTLLCTGVYYKNKPVSSTISWFKWYTTECESKPELWTIFFFTVLPFICLF